MRKIFKLQDLDCANCATKMEQAISKIEGVQSIRVNFMTQKMTLEADDARFESIVDEAARQIKKIESHCMIIR